MNIAIRLSMTKQAKETVETLVNIRITGISLTSLSLIASTPIFGALCYWFV